MDIPPPHPDSQKATNLLTALVVGLALLLFVVAFAAWQQAEDNTAACVETCPLPPVGTVYPPDGWMPDGNWGAPMPLPAPMPVETLPAPMPPQGLYDQYPAPAPVPYPAPEGGVMQFDWDYAEVLPDGCEYLQFDESGRVVGSMMGPC